ncbi:YggS family pyridoxal phosphate-dependent enzyme [Anaerosphaera multitolerans]|uniref:Pyridoxal phosphate homeostasis protein n=1 Tax=Anaerosphaera multitolerans TaxID=2487351 RepID=A0A437S946_9FIRM|nr:YggS family pyridoxal phosphate-dependent enzyme [Anaerosphaera multitolerans]RVU55384.1 YggS family pyridoxal phosphate-dependent enzyme [Anaerosphaera multitolerans]
MNIKENLFKILEEIEDAKKYSITNEDVTLVAVTKTRTIEEINEVHSLGIDNIGENKVQELKNKIDLLNNSTINYHMIGNLQTNKVKYIYDKVALIHSLDRLNLIKELDKRAKNDNIFINCLIQVNIGDEPQKGGVAYEETESFLEKCLEYDNVKIKGLMTIAPNVNDELFLRECFQKMFKLKEKIKSKNYKEVEMQYLSMGMSGDFKIAIEEGSNMVRIGTSIFGSRN